MRRVGEWYREVGSKTTTKQGNLKKPTEDDVNNSVVAALKQISPELVKASWRHTLIVPMNLIVTGSSVEHHLIPLGFGTKSCVASVECSSSKT